MMDFKAFIAQDASGLNRYEVTVRTAGGGRHIFNVKAASESEARAKATRHAGELKSIYNKGPVENSPDAQYVGDEKS